MLLATIFIAMPMIIFEQAKDMKVDPGLYFISISALYITFKLFISDNSDKLKNKALKLL